MTKDPFRKAYTQQKSNAKRRGIDFLISFEDWKAIWLASGKWDQRGKRAGQYCMRRVGDLGPYAPGNVFIGTVSENVSDAQKGRPDSAETRRKRSLSLKGKPHPWCTGANNAMHRPEVKAKLSASISGGKHYSARAVNTPFGQFGSIVEAADALGVNRVTAQWRTRHSKFGWSYADKGAA